MKTDTAKQLNETVLNIGKALSKGRENLSLSLQDVADALKLPLLTVQNLENNCFDELHGDIFVRSYVKAYAELVALDAEPLLSALNAQQNVMQHCEADVSMLALENSWFQHKHHRTGLGLIAIASVVLVAAVSARLTPDNNDLSLVESDYQSQEIVVETALGTTTISSLDLLSPENPTQGLLADIAPVGSDEKIALKQSMLDKEARLISTLNFQFTADCWVEVFDGDDQRIYASLKKASDILKLSGKPPFRVTLGYAPGVSLSYNGEPVAIKSKKSRNQLTKLVLGSS